MLDEFLSYDMLDTVLDTRTRENKDRLCYQEALTSEVGLWKSVKQGDLSRENHIKMR